MSQFQEISRLTKDLGRASELRNEATEAMRRGHEVHVGDMYNGAWRIGA